MKLAEVMEVLDALVSKECLLGRQLVEHCSCSHVTRASLCCRRNEDLLTTWKHVTGEIKSQSVLHGKRFGVSYDEVIRLEHKYCVTLLRYLQTVMKKVF